MRKSNTEHRFHPQNTLSFDEQQYITGGRLPGSINALLLQEFQILDDAVIALEKRIETQHPTTEIGRRVLHAEEVIIKGLENKLEEMIKRLSS